MTAHAQPGLSEHDRKIIKEAFVPLNNRLVVSNDSLNEFRSLYELASRKSVVAVGEATHGTDEIRRIQIILAEGLVANSGYKTIALGEISMLEAYPLFDYVVNGNGNPEKISERFHYDYSGLLKWINQFNSGKPRDQKVWLLGTDVDTPEQTIDFVRNHCHRYSLNKATALVNKLEKIVLSGNKDLGMKELDDFYRLRIDLAGLLNAEKGKADSLDFKADFMVRALDFLPGRWLTGVNSLIASQQRDQVIFDNLEWSLGTKGKTVIINGHNFHTNRKTIIKETYHPPARSFGEYLSDKFGQEYLSIGTEIQSGLFYNGTSADQKIVEDDQKLGSVLGRLFQSDFGLLMVDEKLKAVLNRQDLKITKGTFTSSAVDGKGLLGEAFDAWIYIRSSTPYTTFNKEDYGVLFLNLKNQEEIIKNGKLFITASYAAKEKSGESSVIYSIYLHDGNKKELKHYTDPVKNEEEKTYEIPANTKTISVSLIFKKMDYFELNEFTVNKRSAVKNLDLYDWNRTGYKLKPAKKGILISK